MVEGSESTPAAGSHRRKQLLALGLAVLVVALVVGAIVALTSSDDDSPSAAPEAVPSTSAGADGSGPGAGAQGGRTTTTLTPEQQREAALKARAAERAKRGATASTTPGGPGGKAGTPTTATKPPDTVSPTVEKAYVDAYNATCADIWRIAGPDGQLIDISSGDEEDAGQAFLVTDCQGLRDPLDTFFYDTVPDATAGGRSDAFWNLNNAMVGNILRNTAGTQTYRVPVG